MKKEGGRVFLSCCIKTPEVEGDAAGIVWFGPYRDGPRPDEVWVNAWSTDNKERRPVGMSYCALVFIPEEDVLELEGEDEGVIRLVSGMTIRDDNAFATRSAGLSAQPGVSSLEPIAGAGPEPQPPYPAQEPASSTAPARRPGATLQAPRRSRFTKTISVDRGGRFAPRQTTVASSSGRSEDEELSAIPEAQEEGVTDTADDRSEGVPELVGLTLQEPPLPPPQAEPEDSTGVGMAEPMEWQDELESGMKPVVTPLLSGEAVRTLLSRSKMSGDYAWEAERLRLGIRIVFPEEAKKMEQIPISDRQWNRSGLLMLSLPQEKVTGSQYAISSHDPGA